MAKLKEELTVHHPDIARVQAESDWFSLEEGYGCHQDHRFSGLQDYRLGVLIIFHSFKVLGSTCVYDYESNLELIIPDVRKKQSWEGKPSRSLC